MLQAESPATEAAADSSEQTGTRTVTEKPSAQSGARTGAATTTSLADFKDGDLLALDFGADDSSPSSDGGGGDDDAVADAAARLAKRDWFLEVVASDAAVAVDGKEAVVGVSRGCALTLIRDVADGSLKLEPAPDSAQPKLASEKWVRAAFPEWQFLLAELAGSKQGLFFIAPSFTQFLSPPFALFLRHSFIGATRLFFRRRARFRLHGIVTYIGSSAHTTNPVETSRAG